MEIDIENRADSETAVVPGESKPGAVGNPELLPLVVGVTGHRDPREEDRERLEATVLEIFQGLRRGIPIRPSPFCLRWPRVPTAWSPELR